MDDVRCFCRIVFICDVLSDLGIEITSVVKIILDLFGRITRSNDVEIFWLFG